MGTRQTEQFGISRAVPFSPFSSVEIATKAQIVNRFAVASISFHIWDLIVTFDDEVSLIWTQTWSFMKVIYLLARYLSVLFQIPLLLRGSELSVHFHFTRHDCFNWQLYQIIISLIIVSAMDIILIGRVRAMYRGNLLVQGCVFLVFACEMAGIMGGTALFIEKIEYTNTCIIISMPPLMAISGLGPMMLMQTILFILTTYKFQEHVRGQGNVGSLIGHLMRDGTWAFFLLFLMDILQVALYAASSPASVGLFTWRLTVGSVCGYRVFLNLRRFHQDGLRRRLANIQELTPITSGSLGSLSYNGKL